MARRAAARPDVVDLMLEQWKREAPDVDASAMAVFGRLHRTFNQYQAHLARMFDTYCVNIPGFGVLAALRRAGRPYRCTAGELADVNLLTSGGLTQRVDRLETAGLVRRERDPRDRRIVYIQLTDAGFALTEELIAAHFANELRMLGDLSPAECKQLARLLGRLGDSLERAEAADS